jgi:two-component system, NarL family, nitrate/nitrite response regulator NarL
VPSEQQRQQQLSSPREGARIAVLVVGDVRLYREGLADELRGRPELRVAGTASDAAGALARVGETRPDVVLLDVSIPGSYDLVRATIAALPSTRVVAFAVHESDRDLVACAEAGAAGVVPRDVGVDALVAAILAAVRGELRISPRSAAILFRRVGSMSSTERVLARERSALGTLTAREREIASLLCRGRSNKEIGHELHIEVATVKNLVHRILETLRVTSRSAAAARVRAVVSGA